MSTDKGKVQRRGPLSEEQKKKRAEAKTSKRDDGKQRKQSDDLVTKPDIPFRGVFSNAKWESIDSITPYDKNPKEHPPEQVARIAKSIKSFNFDQPIVVDRDRIIIKGHGRYLAAKSLGYSEVPIIVRTDMSENETRAARIADNQTAESYWHIGNLLREMEALYGMDFDLDLTGYGQDEIKIMYPGLLETEEDFALVNDLEGVTPSESLSLGPDGLVGKPIPKSDRKTALPDWLNSFEKVIVPFSGDRMGLAALCYCIQNGIDQMKLTIVDTFFGQRLWRWHDDYLRYVEKTLGVDILQSQDRLEEWLEEIKKRGYPTKEVPWCCNWLRMGSIEAQFTENPFQSVVVWGTPKQPDGAVLYRERGVILGSGVSYAAPFNKQTDLALTKTIQSSGVNLNPLYKVTDMYLCPGCPRYSRPDFVFLKEHDLDLWIRWMIYFGKSQFCGQYVDEHFNDTALDLIGDGIDPREYGKHREYASDLPECPQPMRNVVRAGDNYGWNPEEDKKLPAEDRLDKPRDAWWDEVGYSDVFIKMKGETETYHRERGDAPLEDWLKVKIQEAKQVAAAEA